MNFLNINQLKAAELEELFQLADNFYIPESNTFKQDPILADKKVLNLYAQNRSMNVRDRVLNKIINNIKN